MSSFEWPPTGGGSASGTVTSVSVVSAHGFAGTVANPTSTPAITLSTTITGILKGDGTSISAATIGNLTEATSSVLTISGGTSSVLGSGLTIQVKQSSGSVSGYLSSTDWTTFNGKQATGNYATSGTGDVTWSAPSGAGPVTTSIAATTNATFTTLSALTTASSLATVGTITAGTWNATTLALNHGGTGQTTKAAAFDALQPMTTGGDLIYGGASGTGTRLANGSAGQVLTSAGTTLAPVWAPPATSGTVTSVTFTGDGTVLSSTPSSAVTTTGTVTASLATQTKNTFLAGPTTGSNAAPTFRVLATADLTAPTVQKFTGTGTQSGWLFTVTSANATVGATYTNNSNTFTVLGTISAGTQLWMSGTGATSGGTLTKSGGTGDSTITFSSKVSIATYTTPTSPRSPLYLRIRGVGGGGGGATGGTAGSTAAVSGSVTGFGANLIFGNGGTFSTYATRGGAGGTASIGTAIGQSFPGGAGTGPSDNLILNSTNLSGGCGGSSIFGGGGGGGPGGTATSTESNAGVNSGSGGGGGGSNGQANNLSGGGGGAGGGFDALLTSSIAATYPYVIGTGGAGGTQGTNGLAGGAGADGVLIIEEFYQ